MLQSQRQKLPWQSCKALLRTTQRYHPPGEPDAGAEQEKARAWLAKIKRSDVVPGMYKDMRVCSDHFVSGTPSTLHDVNNQDWAPSLKLVFETVAKSTLQAKSKRYERAVKRRKLCDELCAEVDKEVHVVEDDTEDDCVVGDCRSVAV